MIATNPIARAGAPDLTDDTLVGNWCSPYGNNPWQDVSGHGYTGTPVAAGRDNDGSVLLNGTTSYINIGDYDAFSPYGDGSVDCGLTIAGWVRCLDLMHQGAMMSKGNGGAYEWGLYSYASAFQFVVWSLAGNEYGMITSGVLETNRWHHAVGVLDYKADATGRMDLYVNGALSGSDTTLTLANKPSGGVAPVQISRRNDGSGYIYGSLLDMRFYSEAKSLTWIRELYKAGVPR